MGQVGTENWELKTENFKLGSVEEVRDGLMAGGCFEGGGARSARGREKRGGQKTRSKFLPVICDLLKCAALSATDPSPDPP